MTSNRYTHELFYRWQSFRYMCRNPKSPSYKYYGGRGIGYDLRWDNWDVFVFEVESEIGKLPFKNAHFDRIDNNRGFFPGNIQWATPQRNMNNRQSNHMLTAFGKTQSLKDWHDESGINDATIWSRIFDHSWSIEDAVKIPPYQKRI